MRLFRLLKISSKILLVGVFGVLISPVEGRVVRHGASVGLKGRHSVKRKVAPTADSIAKIGAVSSAIAVGAVVGSAHVGNVLLRKRNSGEGCSGNCGEGD